MEHLTKIIAIEKITHDVIQLIAQKPANLTYIPGQAVDVSINKPDWEEQLRPFTFTSLPDDENIEFTIKTYPEHNGVTEQLLKLTKGDELIIHDVFGDIQYKGEGIFLAGGAGVTPFIAIFKQLEKTNQIGNNKLIFANKTKADIILEDKFQKLLKENFINVLSKDDSEGYEHGYITPEIIKKNTNSKEIYYYLCGPEPMMEALENQLAKLDVPSKYIVKEAF